MDMSGLEKIIDQIQRDAAAACAEIQAKSDAEKAEILAKATDTCAKMDAQASLDAEALRADLLSRGKSSAQMQRKNRILTAKQTMIQDVIAQSREKLSALPTVDYFVLLLKLTRKYVQKGDGVMYLSQTDLQRAPAYFPGKLNEIAQEKGGTLVLSDKPRDIGGGFVLAYGGIEENCSFEALFEAEKERLQDIVRAQLFS